MNYLPEWKIYFWKKLIIDADKLKNRELKIDDLMYFNEKQIKEKENERMQDMINYIKMIDSGQIEIPNITHRSEYIENAFFNFSNEKIANELIELANSKPTILELRKISLGKDYIETYRQERKQFKEKELRRANGGSVGSGVGYDPTKNEKWENYFTDKFCSLNEGIYQKTTKGNNLTTSEFEELIKNKLEISPYEFISFELSLDKSALENQLNNYIDSFIAGDLIPENQGVRYLSTEQQRRNFSIAIKSLVPNYGHKNIITTLKDIAQIHRWKQPLITDHKFYETFLSLERTGEIEINNLRDDEIIFSIAPASLRHFKDQIKFIPAYGKFQNKFKDKEIHWYCPICGNKVKMIESLDKLKECLTKKVINCRKGHENRISITGDKILLENIPIPVSQIMRPRKKTSPILNKSLDTDGKKN